MKKKIFITISFLTVLAVSYGAFLYHKPHKNIETVESDITANATELIAQFNTNKDQISNNLFEKVLEVSGTITHIEQSSEHTLLILDDGIKCELHTINKELSPGNTVKLKGVYSGFDEMFNEISLIRCYLIKD